MGSNPSKLLSEETEDYRYMKQKDRRNVDFFPKWEKRYGFDRRLDVEKLEFLVRQIYKDCDKDVKKQSKLGLYTAGVWLSEAKKRKRRAENENSN